MQIFSFIKLIMGIPGVFISPLPWQAELAFLIICALVLGLPAILKSIPQPSSPSRKGRKSRTRRTSTRRKDV